MSESPKDAVARLIEAREDEPEEKTSVVHDEGLYPFTEIERLKLETLMLKQELYQAKLKELGFYMTDLENGIRSRLALPDGFEIRFNQGPQGFEVVRSDE